MTEYLRSGYQIINTPPIGTRQDHNMQNITVMKMTSKVTYSSTDIGRNAATDEDVNQEESRHKDDKYQSKSSSYKIGDVHRR